MDRRNQYTVGWICALSTERAAAQAMLDEKHHDVPKEPGDNNTYTLGRIGAHNIVIACLPSGVYKVTSAARVAEHMLFTFKRIRFGLMVGIGWGAPSQAWDIRLGLVVVSEPTAQSGGVIQFDFGKRLAKDQFILTSQLNRPPDVLLTALSKLKANHRMRGDNLQRQLTEMFIEYPLMESQYKHPGTQHDQLYDAEYEHQSDDAFCANCDVQKLVRRPSRESDRPLIHYGTIASAMSLNNLSFNCS